MSMNEMDPVDNKSKQFKQGRWLYILHIFLGQAEDNTKQDRPHSNQQHQFTQTGNIKLQCQYRSSHKAFFCILLF